MKEFENHLLAERQKILKEMGHLENTVLKVNQRDSSGDLSGYSFHMADAGTDAMEREKAFLFASAEGRTLLEINEALRRLYRGEYGVCESCGLPIARARLEAMPHARLCVSCKQREEQASRGQGQGQGPGQG
jgi:DnaK suppressor protein